MKDYNEFRPGGGICYIPENEDQEYTYEDILEIANGNSSIASMIFDQLEWQHPETLFEEGVQYNEWDYEGNILNHEQYEA